MNDWSIIGDLVAIVTAAGVMIYVLGLVGLAISINLLITNDVSKAWYAVSLLPRTVVAGQGARIWVSWPFVLTIAMVLLALVIQGAFNLWPELTQSPVNRYVDVEIWIPVVFAFILASLVQKRVIRAQLEALQAQIAQAEAKAVAQILSATQDAAQAQVAQAQRRREIYEVPSLTWVPWVLSLAGTYIMAFGSILLITEPQTSEPPTLNLGRGVTSVLTFLAAIEAPFSVAILVIFFGSFFIGARASMAAKPPLPQVAITMKSEDRRQQDPAPLKGQLVTHSDSFWHLFERITNCCLSRTSAC